MKYLKEIEESSTNSGKHMTSSELAEKIAEKKTEVAIHQAMLRGYQSAMKVKLNQNPVVSR